MAYAVNSISLTSMASMPNAAVASTRPASAPTLADAEARQLSANVARGDESAFCQLYDAYHCRVFRLALVLGQGDDLMALEVAQTAFLTAAAKLPKVASADHLWNWLARVTRQQLAKARRQRQRDAVVIGVEELPETAIDAQPDTALEECLNVALQSLDPRDRELLEWFYFDRLSQKEIADRLGNTPKAVSSRLERARTRLRAHIAKSLSREP